MKKTVKLILLVLIFEIFATGILYSQEVQYTVKESSIEKVNKFLADWEERNRQQSAPAIDVSGTWCFVQLSVSSEDPKKPGQKIVLKLKQDNDGTVSGSLHVRLLEENEWKPTQEFFMFQGRVSGNILTATLFGKEGDIISKYIFSFKENSFEGAGINSKEPPEISEGSAIRCSG